MGHISDGSMGHGSIPMTHCLLWYSELVSVDNSGDDTAQRRVQQQQQQQQRRRRRRHSSAASNLAQSAVVRRWCKLAYVYIFWYSGVEAPQAPSRTDEQIDTCVVQIRYVCSSVKLFSFCFFSRAADTAPVTELGRHALQRRLCTYVSAAADGVANDDDDDRNDDGYDVDRSEGGVRPTAWPTQRHQVIITCPWKLTENQFCRCQMNETKKRPKASCRRWLIMRIINPGIIDNLKV